MNKVHSHYDNLRVTQNAPLSVIKAAYRTLSQQYHPDRCHDPDAQRIMGVLNRSYEVLSDPDGRRAHDEWIARQERTVSHEPSPPVADGQGYGNAAGARTARAAAPKRHPKPEPKLPETIYFWPLVFSLLRAVPWRVWAVVLAIAVFVGWPSVKTMLEPLSASSAAVTQSDAPTEAPSTSPLPSPSAVPTPSLIAKPASTLSYAPNGTEWPAAAGYLPGYDVDATGGYSTLTIDNTSNDYDVYVKLSFPGATPAAVYRHVYIPRRHMFTMEELPSGTY